MNTPKIYPLSETALCIEWGNTINELINQQVIYLNRILNKDPFTGFIESVPAYASLTVYYQAELLAEIGDHPFLFVKRYIENLLHRTDPETPKKEPVILIPVCYDEEFGCDLEFVASANGISKEEVVSVHQQKEYNVYMMGFLPGFAYMGEVDNAIATPRKKSPRANVEEGSVGIAGKQTGIYPIPSPGGWQIIGRTPLCLFDLQKENPFLFKTGESIRFHAITKEEFYRIKNQQKKNTLIDQKENKGDAIIIKPGIFSTLQDGGRFGYRSYGLPHSGAMDDKAYHIANALAGNPKNAAAIECTMGGLMIRFNKNAGIAITGAGIAFVNHQKINFYQPLSVFRNDLLEIKYNNDGIRSYIAVSGGFAAPEIMNSRSTYSRANLGSMLKKGDVLTFDNVLPASTKKMPAALLVPTYSQHATIRIIKGPENDWIKPESIPQFYSQKFTLTNDCDRMGYKLQGNPLFLSNTSELLSTAVTRGTIQLTPDGQLIILMNDCQTTGGYPRVAQIAAGDLCIIAQLKPGDTVRFINISFGEAEELYLLQQKKFDEFFS